MTIRVCMARYGAPEVLEAHEMSAGSPGAGEVRLRTAHVGVNPRDLHIRSGLIPQTGNWPYVPGNEAIGVVDAVGPDITRLQRGDRVFFLGLQQRASDAGAYQQLPVVPASRVAKIPGSLAKDPSACLGLHTVTAWITLQRLGLQPGMRALIHAGETAVGAAAVRICALEGVHVITTTNRFDRASWLRRAGAAEVVDIGDPIWHMDVEPVDRVLELVGTATFERSLRLLTLGGAMMLAGSSSGSRMDLDALHLQGKTLSGFSTDMLSVDDIESALMALTARPELCESIEVHHFDLADAAAAHQALADGTVSGRVVLDCDP